MNIENGFKLIFYFVCALDVIWMLIIDSAFRKGNRTDKTDVVMSSFIIIPLLTVMTYYSNLLCQ